MKRLKVLTDKGIFPFIGEGERGDIVEVEVGNKRTFGVILDVEGGDGEGLKLAKNFNLRIPTELLDLINFASKYYHYPQNLYLKLVLPSRLRKISRVYYVRVSDKVPNTKFVDLWEYLKKPRTKDELVKMFGKRAVYYLRRWESLNLISKIEKVKIPKFKPPKIYDLGEVEIPESPNLEQMRAINSIISSKGFSTFYLWGPTGSGKTLVYLKVVERFLAEGKGALILVPEILLSYHIARAFQKAFGENFAIYHGSLGDKLNVWYNVAEGKVKVVMGTRSAVFLPIRDLGVILVDEEFDESFKEEGRIPFYNARDLAIYRGKILNIPVVLGSATPSLESFHNIRIKKYKPLILTKKIHGGNVSMEVVDMNREKKVKGIFSERMIYDLLSTLQSGKNAIIYVNRRGYLPYFFCADCGTPVKCENCDVVLALHRGKFGEFLKCHICGFSTDIPLSCGNCGSTNLIGVGFGTQRVEEELSEILKVEVFRMDSDKIRKREEVIRLLKEFGEGKIRVLVGTKMVIKGLDFPNVSLVVILNADQFLYRGGDFRAEERALQILYQIAGRIRGEGKLLIQTYNPNHPVLREFLRGDLGRSYERIYGERKGSDFPPFRRMAFFEIRTPSEENDRINFKILENFVENYTGVTLWGPSYPPMRKLRGMYRVRVVILGKDHREVLKALSDLERLPLRGRKIFNVDPMSSN